MKCRFLLDVRRKAQAMRLRAERKGAARFQVRGDKRHKAKGTKHSDARRKSGALGYCENRSCGVFGVAWVLLSFNALVGVERVKDRICQKGTPNRLKRPRRVQKTGCKVQSQEREEQNPEDREQGAPRRTLGTRRTGREGEQVAYRLVTISLRKVLTLRSSNLHPLSNSVLYAHRSGGAGDFHPYIRP